MAIVLLSKKILMTFSLCGIGLPTLALRVLGLADQAILSNLAKLIFASISTATARFLCKLPWTSINVTPCCTTSNRAFTDLSIPLAKSHKTRRVPLSDQALSLLRSLDSVLESPWVFPDPLNALKLKKPLPRRRPPQAHFPKGRIAWKLAYAMTTTHRSTRRLLAGVDLVTVSKILGHRTIHITMRYLHLVQDHMASAINRGSVVFNENEGNFQNQTGTKSGTLAKT